MPMKPMIDRTGRAQPRSYTVLRPLTRFAVSVSVLAIAGLFFAFAPPAHAQASQTLPADMHASAAKSLDLVFREDYRNAEAEADKIIRTYPDHPAGYFFKAAVADAWMQRFQSNRREAEFHRLCDQAIERAESILAATPNDEWARFFLGASDGLKGTFEARYERYITAFRFGWKGVSVFLRMASEGSSNPDIRFGIGTYDYWRSALMRLLWWMPGVPDKRADGINTLRGVMQNGVYSRTSAAMVLVEIYQNEGLHQDALNLSDRMLQQYPRALVFHWSRAAALFGLKRYEEAIAAYRQIFERVEKDANSNFYNSVQSRMGMARSMAALGQSEEAKEQLTAIDGYTLSRDIRKRLEALLKEAETLKRRV